jgi:hypothetical protein
VSSVIQKLAREPLLHFVLLGSAIFFISSWLARDHASGPREIVVTQGKIQNLSVTFERTWQRPPTENELDELIREHIREEVAYREALALELDRDDSVVRRRLRQKLEFISQDLAAQVEPTDDDLRAYWKAHAEAFDTDSKVTFKHVYFNPERHDDVSGDAAKALVGLKPAGDDVQFAAYGDMFLLGNEFEDISIDQLRSSFDDAFAARVAELPAGEWIGPVESGYGVHLVFVVERTEGDVPPFEEVRETVRRDWVNAKRLDANEAFYQALLEGYTVIVEEPDGARRQVVGAAR